MAMAVHTARVAEQFREAVREMARLAVRRDQPSPECGGIEPGRGPLAETRDAELVTGAERAHEPPVAEPPGPAGAERWRLDSFTELSPEARAVPQARRHVRGLLRQWKLDALADGAELVVSELVTNAVRAAGGTGVRAPVRLWLLSDGHSILILVWDDSPQPPTRLDAGDDAENGRGLLLVEALSTQWSWWLTDHCGGKVVWAHLAADERREPT